MSINRKISTFAAFCEMIEEYASNDKDFVMLATEEITETDFFSNLHQEKFIATESPVESAILQAAGKAATGKRPWLIGRTAELAGRGYAYIREAIALPGLPVRIVAINGGLSSAHDGAAVLLLEDLALMRTIPGMNVFIPSDAAALRGILERIGSGSGPIYMRLGCTPVPALEDNYGESFRVGGARILRNGIDVTICACGIMVSQALIAAEQLDRRNIGAEVIDCYSLKPFPENLLLSSVRRTGCCVTAEEHGGIGGLFGAVAECLGRTYPVPLRSVAAEDSFVNSGTPEELREYYGLTWKEIVDASSQAWALRRR